MTVSTHSRKAPWPDWMPPSLAAWFYANFPSPTSIQRLAWRRIFHGGNVVVIGPAGSGKTLAAFLTVLAQLGSRAQRGNLPNQCLAVYLSPAKDSAAALHEPLAALNAALPPASRIRAAGRNPHLLLATPESLLSQRNAPARFAPETVIVDQLHELAESPRGALLSLVLERLQSQAPHTLQRIGLSAAAQPADALAQLFCGRRPCAIVAESIRRTHRLEIHVPRADPPRAQPAPIEFHGTPRSISHTLQRLVRGANGVATGHIVPVSPFDLLEAFALRQAALAGYIEDLAIPPAPLNVLAHFLRRLSLKTPAQIDEAWEQVRAAGPYLHLARAGFDAALAGHAPPPGPRSPHEEISLSHRMIEEELRLRRHLRAAWSDAGRPAVETLLREAYQATNRQAQLAAEFIERHCQFAPVPIDSPVQIECINRARRRVVIVHCLAGRAVNQSLVDGLAPAGIIGARASDHGHLLVLRPKQALDESTLRRAYHPNNFETGPAKAIAQKIFDAPWELFTHPRPSPFALPLYAARSAGLE